MASLADVGLNDARWFDCCIAISVRRRDGLALGLGRSPFLLFFLLTRLSDEFFLASGVMIIRLGHGYSAKKVTRQEKPREADISRIAAGEVSALVGSKSDTRLSNTILQLTPSRRSICARWVRSGAAACRHCNRVPNGCGATNSGVRAG
jgi:hypothetical protein